MNVEDHLILDSISAILICIIMDGALIYTLFVLNSRNEVQQSQVRV